MPRLLQALVLVVMLSASGLCTADWHVQGVEWSFFPSTRTLRARLGEFSFLALEGMEPLLEIEGKPTYLGGDKVRLVKAHTHGDELVCDYELEGPEGPVPWRLAISPGKDCLRLHFTAPASPLIRRVFAGACKQAGKWQRYDLSRYAEAHGQVWWEKTAYLPAGDCWLNAHWLIEKSNATALVGPNPAGRGEGDFEVAQEPEYRKRLDGYECPVDETLEVRLSHKLWDVVPQLTQPPSEYSGELAQSVFLDLWTGSARELSWFLAKAAQLSLGKVRLLSVVENWEAGGFDALLPDSVKLPDYPPNPALGSLKDWQALAALGKRLGRCAFRTNYMMCKDASPSLKAGEIHRAVAVNGKPAWYTSNREWLPFARRQEAEIKQLFVPNAAFSDQLTSGAMPSVYHDYSTHLPGEPSLRETLERQRQLCRFLKEFNGGPLGSETLIDQHNLGYWVDFGDFGIMDGHHRFFSTEYKLRRLQHLVSVHGMGLMYRFFASPPWRKWADYWQPQLRDDYRLCELLYGNGGYVFYHPGAPWDYVAGELLLVGSLQPYFMQQRLERVLYWSKGEWKTLEQLAKEGFVPNTQPWLPQPEEFARTRVEYANGYNFVCNRREEDFPVVTPFGETVLPKAGWVAWCKPAGLIAYSAFWPGTKQRVDYLKDESRAFEYLDPRGQPIRGGRTLRCWEKGKLVLSLEAHLNKATVKGEQVDLAWQRPPALKTLDFDFRKGACGWQAVRSVKTLEKQPDGLLVRCIADDPILVSPPLAIEGRPGDALQVALASWDGELVQVYFANEEVGISEARVFHIHPPADGKVHVYELQVGKHLDWAGHTLVQLRLDPRQGPGKTLLQYMKLIRADGS